MIITFLHFLWVQPTVYLLKVLQSYIHLLTDLAQWTFMWISHWKNKERAKAPRCLTDPVYGRHAFIQLKHIKLHYVENGDPTKPLMLFIHGFPEFWFTWRYQLKKFASSHWVVALDCRGYGDSDKPENIEDYDIKYLEKDVMEFLRVLTNDGRKSCTVVAHDWGGVIGWNVTAKYPKLVDKLIILNSPHPTTFRRKLRGSITQMLKSWYILFFQLKHIPEKGMMSRDMIIFNQMFVDEKNNLSVAGDHLEAYKYTFSKKNAWTWPINYYRQNLNPKAMEEFEQNPLPQITVPTLVIWGENDFVFTKDIPELARPYVDNLTVIYVPNGNHFVHHDKPVQVNQHIEKFLKI